VIAFEAAIIAVTASARVMNKAANSMKKDT
jgi:hypothetical protein